VKIIPAIDLHDGKCVRLYKGDFGKVTHYSDQPLEIARTYAALSVNDLHVRYWLGNGVARCVVGSVAVGEPARVAAWIDDFGPDRIVLALDVTIAEEGPLLATHGWTESSGLSLWDMLDRYASLGAKHVLCTDISRDGAMSGPNIELYSEILRRYPEICLQASGGVRDIADIARLKGIGVPAAITGKAMLDGKISAAEVDSFLRSA
jgi:phosphoribosylformimino-5-aminoimidazole carboxamide ribotide isomerase